MGHLACFRTHTEPILGPFTFSPMGYCKPPRGDSKSNNRFADMKVLSSPKRSNFDRLPTELILKICEHLSTFDLWHSIRPASRLLATCAEELLPRKFFQENTIHVGWCCFWCSLGTHSIHSACTPITGLFPTAKNVEITGESNRAIMTKVIFGNLCNLVTGREPRIRIRLGEEEQYIRFGNGEILPQEQKPTRDSVQDLRFRQRKFLAWYFAKRRQQVVKGRIIGYVGFAAHLSRFFATSIVLLLIGLALTVFACISFEVFKMFKDSYKGLRNLLRFCLGKGPLPH